MNIEFVGISSGDYESYCFDVDKETFVRLEGREPRQGERSYFNNGLYRFYPFNNSLDRLGKCKVKITVEEV